MHTPTNAIGAVRLHAPGEYIGPLNGAPLTCEVLEFTDGSSIVVREDGEHEFVKLGVKEAQFYGQVMQVSHEMVKTMATFARTMGLSGELAATIIGRVLSTQGNVLLPRGAPGPLPETVG